MAKRKAAAKFRESYINTTIWALSNNVVSLRSLTRFAVRKISPAVDNKGKWEGLKMHFIYESPVDFKQRLQPSGPGILASACAAFPMKCHGHES